MLKRFISCAAFLLAVFSVHAQNLYVSEKMVERWGDKIFVSFKVATSETAVGYGEKIFVTPVIKQVETGDSTFLKTFFVAGHQQEKILRQQEKLSRKGTGEVLKCIGNGETLSFYDILDYPRNTDPSEQEAFELHFTAKKMDCCNVVTCLDERTVFVVRKAVEPIVLQTVPNVSCVSDEVAGRYPFLRKVGEEAEAQRGISIRFSVSSTEIDPEFSENSRYLSEIMDAIRMIKEDSWTELETIDIVGYASPEGDVQKNLVLSRERAEALKRYIMDGIALDAGQFNVTAGGEDWTGLRKLVSESSMSKKSEIIDIIDNVPADERQYRLKSLDDGISYRILLSEMYPKLRDACYINVWFSEKEDVTAHEVNAAVEEIHAGRYAEALERLMVHKNDPRTWNAIGSIRFLTKDLEDAKKWFSMAAEAGDSDAAKNLARIEDILIK